MSDDAVRDYVSDDEQIVTKAALLLRKQILDVQKKDLPGNPTLENLKKTMHHLTPVINFFHCLLLWTKSNEVHRPCHALHQVIL